MIARSNLMAGPGYVIAPGPVSFRVAGLIKVELVWEADNIKDALKGAFTKVVKNRYLRATFTPLYRDATNTDAIFFPYISLLATPLGTQIFTTSDQNWVFVANSGLSITFKAGAVTQMPTIFAGANSPIFGQMTVIGVNATGTDTTSSSSFYAQSTGNSFTPPAIPGTATLLRQKWTAAYGSNTGWASFQSYNGFAITHELGLSPIYDNGQQIGALLTGYRPMCKATPTGNTIAQLLSQMAFSGSGAAQGQRYDANENDLVLSGAVAGSITLKNASIEAGEVNMDADVLHQGPVSFIGNVGDNSGANVAGLILT